MAERKHLIEPRMVRRRFTGPTPDGGKGVFVYVPPMVADVVGWRGAGGLEDANYLRKLEYGEDYEDGPNGISVMCGRGAGTAGAQPTTGGENGPPQSQASPEAALPASSEDQDEDEGPVVAMVTVGGGWYNVTVDGEIANGKPLHGKANAEAFVASL